MYSAKKKSKLEIEGTEIVVRHLDPIQSNKLLIKCVSAVTPSLGALCDGVMSEDRTLTLSTAGQLFVQNLTSDEIETIMLKVLGGIEDLEGEVIGEDAKAINTWFAYNQDVEMIDVFSEVFEQSIVAKLLKSSLFQKVMPSIQKVKEAFNGDKEDA